MYFFLPVGLPACGIKVLTKCIYVGIILTVEQPGCLSRALNTDVIGSLRQRLM